LAIRNAPEGRATISSSKLQHSLDALRLGTFQAGRLPRHRCQAISPRDCYLPSSHSRREEAGHSGKSRGKGGPLGQSPESPRPCQLFPLPSGAAPGASAAPLHSRTHSDSEGQEGPRGGLGCSQGWKCPGASLMRVAAGDTSICREARHPNPFLSAAAPPSPVCQRGSRQRSVAGSPGRSPRESRRPEGEGTGSATGSFSFVSSPTPRGRGAATAVTGSGQPTAEDTCTRDLSTRSPALAPYPRSRKRADRKCGVLGPGQPLSRSQARAPPRLYGARASPRGLGPPDSAPGRGPVNYIRESARTVAGVTGLQRRGTVHSLRSAALQPDILYPFPTRVLRVWRVEVAVAHHRGAESLSTTGEKNGMRKGWSEDECTGAGSTEARPSLS
jgi:hypothetical protein